MAATAVDTAPLVLIDIAIVVALARCAGVLFRRVRQPSVVGEILVGIALGPTLLGALPLGAGHTVDSVLFPAPVLPPLTDLADLGLVLFMFIVGLELDLGLIVGKGRRAGTISVSSVALPLALGALLSLALYPGHGRQVSPVAFALFIGVSMSVTAFPVLARILTERNMHVTPLGVLALACAAVDDILAWSLLALTTAVATGSGQHGLLRIALESLCFVAVIFWAVRPLLRRLQVWYGRRGLLTPDMLATVLVGLLVAAWTTDRIGIHFIFGAFLFGVAIPRQGAQALSRDILDRLEQVALLLLLPIFFVTTGLKVDVRALDVAELWQLALILVVACVGKFCGAALAARLQGLPTRTAAAVGILMNTRGLTELVVLNVGFEKQILDRSLLTMLVVMAVVTTVVTEPLLHFVYPDRLVERDVLEAERARLGLAGSLRVLVAVPEPATAGPVLSVGVDLLGGRRPAEVLLSHIRPDPLGSADLGSGVALELADMAVRTEDLRSLARSLEQPGMSASVLSGFSPDAGRELLRQAARLDVDAIVADAGLGVGAAAGWREVAGSRCQLLEVHTDAGVAPPADHDPVCVVLEGSRDMPAAVAVGVWMARSRRTGLRLVPAPQTRRAARQAASLATRLTSAGLPCTVSGPDGDAPGGTSRSLTVREGSAQRTWPALAPAMQVLVHQAAEPPADGLEAVIATLQSTDRTTAEAAPAPHPFS